MESEWLNWVNLELGASLNMLEVAITNATDEIWTAGDTLPFWQIAYHAVFYCNFYFSDFTGKYEKPEDEYQLPDYLQQYAGAHNLAKTANDYPSKSEVQRFLMETRVSLQQAFATTIADQIAEDVSFSWLPMSKGTLLLYNMRHVMMHMGMLNDILRSRKIPTSSWQALKEV